MNLQLDERRAEGRIQLAAQRLAKKYPFHVAILARFRPVSRREVGTMGVAVEGRAVHLYYNAEFVLDLVIDQLAAVLLHEVNHVLFGHVSVDPRNYADRWARTVAEEVTANEFIHEPLPGSPITLENFPQLPAMESTDERYRRLGTEARRGMILVPSGPGQTQDDCSVDGETALVIIGSTVDDHRVWEESAEPREQAALTVESLIAESVLEVGRDRIPEELQAAISTHIPGTRSGTVYHEIKQNRQGQMDWRQLLRRFTGSLLRRQPSFRRPPRRFPELIGVVPGAYRQASQPRVMAIIDTSASITAKLLEEINSELARLARSHFVTVVECDATIHRVYAYRRVRSVQGRGGTDLRPPFQKKFLAKHQPDLIVYFTDGFGSAPEMVPPIPVFWCLTPNGRAPADWGRVVHMRPAPRCLGTDQKYAPCGGEQAR